MAQLQALTNCNPLSPLYPSESLTPQIRQGEINREIVILNEEHIFHKYTPQNNLRTTQWTFPYVVYRVYSVAQIRQNIEKGFSVSFKGVKIKRFPKKMSFKIFIFILSKICNFCQFLKKSCFIIFNDVWPLQYQLYTGVFSLLTM